MPKNKIVTLCLLGTIELALLFVLLPDRWTAPVLQVVNRATAPSYDNSRITHPDLPGELDRSPEVRTMERIVVGICVLLLVANTFAIVRVWRGGREAP
jgi:hypothetical protein